MDEETRPENAKVVFPESGSRIDARVEAAARAGWDWEQAQMGGGASWESADEEERAAVLAVVPVMLAAADAVEARGDREDRLENALRLISEQRDEARGIAEKLAAALHELIAQNWHDAITVGYTHAQDVLAGFEKLRASAPVENPK